MIVKDLGLIEFSAALAIQERMVAEIAAGTEEETLLLLEHSPVYSIGSGGDAGNVRDRRIRVHRINRGGDVTYHGPGQLVGYPLLDLSRRGRDLHRCLRFLEEVLIAVATEYGVQCGRVCGRTGVWTDRGKLVSIGVGVRRWVMMHGFALNVKDDVNGFAGIIPCGIEGCRMTSLEREAAATIALHDVKGRCASHFTDLLDHWMPFTERRPPCLTPL